MSNPYRNSDGRSEPYNAAAAHDTAIYDPNQHDNQIVAVYDTMAQAAVARDALIGSGIERRAIQVVDHTSGDAGGPSVAEDRNQGGFWGVVKSLFAPPEDVSAYQHAIGRGHAMLILTPNAAMDRHRAIQILESSHPIDFDAKLEQWRQAAYDQMPNAGAMPLPDRVGQRETVNGPYRIRSYLARRDESAQWRDAHAVAPISSATVGATASDVDAPRK